MLDQIDAVPFRAQRHSDDQPMRNGQKSRKRSLFSSTILNGLSSLGLVMTAASGATLLTSAESTAQSSGPSVVSVGLMEPRIEALQVSKTIEPVSFLAEGDIPALSGQQVRYDVQSAAIDANVAVGDIVTDPFTGMTERVRSVSVNATGDVVSVVLDNGSEVPVDPAAWPVLQLLYNPKPDPFVDINPVAVYRAGPAGPNGDDGSVTNSAQNGGGGQPGPTYVEWWEVLESRGDIVTRTDGLAGVLAASIGGNGGNGGDGGDVRDPGRGGAGGAGGDVLLRSYANDIATFGEDAHGVVGQSRSGIGGVGGDGNLFFDGADGGAGNDGGNVTVESYGSVTTHNNRSIGVFAQSLGGGGGQAGSTWGLFGAGGNGNRGGNGGTAEARNYGDIITLGEAAYGVSAQSIGGIGGNAGGTTALVAFASAAAPGGDGGSASITAFSGSSVETYGASAYGLFAQSIGGGGGNGATTAALFTLGSTGAAGGAGDRADITVDVAASVRTIGTGSHAVFAQSIGGGGGNAGTSAGGIIAFGGSGTGGGDGGDVSVDIAGAINTHGLEARGVFAQSIGGGGGSARGTFGIFALGGQAGGGGAGGAVSVTTRDSSDITTRQRGSDGIFAQSVGGGGGSGSSAGGLEALGGAGGNGGFGGTVIVENNGRISTAGSYSRGIFAQSVGGGGGSGGDAAGLSTIGGNAGAGGGVDITTVDRSIIITGGAVSVTNRGNISTNGTMSSAIQAQSIGGGGGDGGTSGGAFMTIGGAGGAGGASGLVTVNQSGRLITRQADSHGIFAQSVGGGGGNGGASRSLSAFSGVSLGGSGGQGGDGGRVIVTLVGEPPAASGSGAEVVYDIQTSGERSRGVFAQSVGGGGGSGGMAAQASVGFLVGIGLGIGGSGGKGGNGGVVDVDGDAHINTGEAFSEGILAQSVGGGGGTGGYSTTITYTGGEAGAASFAMALGGTGGDGGDGGTVTLDAGGSILTEGRFSTGLLAQSVGGGGGTGGFSTSFSMGVGTVGSAAVTTGIGGQGGGGGAGGNVNVTYEGAIETRLADSRGAVIQSIGGGGGNGGFNISGAVAGAGSVAAAGAVGVGGAAAVGGNGGSVSGDILGQVITNQDRSIGVVIQSVGGGGGAGGYNISGGVSVSGSLAAGLAVGVGGAGKKGGNGGLVDATAGNITTRGDQSAGFLAQSIGGGGGAGGMNISGTLVASKHASAAIAVGVGGSGAGGGSGGAVIAAVNGNVNTSGQDSDAIIAQSIGGGGGNGGMNVTGTVTLSLEKAGAVGVGVGGNAGGGGSAGAVVLTVDGFARTTGRSSDAILVQSIGGGGGSGGFNTTDSMSLSAGSGGSIGFGVGGSGGAGGDGGTALLLVNEDVEDEENTLLAVRTEQDDSRGIVVQSVGGGGGSGGINVTGLVDLSKDSSTSIGVGLGGSGESGGNSLVANEPETVMAYAYVNGDVVTLGDRSSGILVQSVGGGGGNGGMNLTGGLTAGQGAGSILVGLGGSSAAGGSAGRVGGTIISDVSTGTRTEISTPLGSFYLRGGHDSTGVTFQSLGGGGGNGGLNITSGVTASKAIGSALVAVGIGGSGAGGGNGGAVDGNFTGSVITRGDRSHGILLQSLGGGGGNGGVNVTGALALASSSAGAIGFGLGGFGGAGGTGDNVTASLNGNVMTYGDNALGAIIQSLGGGGGNGGANVTGAASLNEGNAVTASMSIGIGGFGGNGGASGDVVAEVSGSYLTHGANSGGVLAQSLAGGGGNGGVNFSGAVSMGVGDGGSVSVGLGGFGGDAASAAGNVRLTRTGNTETRGLNSTAITAQSIGGGGGNGGVNITASVSMTRGDNGSIGFGLGGFGGSGGDAGDAFADIQGNIWARQAHGLLVQSLGGGGGNGGLNITGALALTGEEGRAVSLGVGGFGAAGGDAGTASLIYGSADTDFYAVAGGNENSAIILQSVGGGGGAGGVNISGGVSSSGSITAGVGGFGGDGGLGGDVSGDIHASLQAIGSRSYGLLAQSVGGGGGSGGINISGGLSSLGSSPDTELSLSLVFGLGGSGGDGNRSGNVDIAHRGSVFVNGNQSAGLLVQSVAGGGGAGGLNVASNFSNTQSPRGYALSVGVGGSGGEGADAGNVTLASDGNITTLGKDFSTGIIAQSVGGGGGQGGMNITGAIARRGNPLSVSVGGSGGGGGNAGMVTVNRGLNARSLISTSGTNSTGLLAQSVGGGGGNGGMNLGFAISRSNIPGTGPQTIAASFQIGGSGGTGGIGNDVTVDHRGDITTRGAASAGLFAQSIGGGGGNASYQMNILATAKSTAGIRFGLGGANGNGGGAGNVNVSHTGAIQTGGADSVGLLAQSIGGGGGSTASNIFLDLVPIVEIKAKPSNQLEVSIGRSGGDGGAAGAVTVTSDGSIRTSGERSSGILAQSVGGGGGTSGTTSVSAVSSSGSGEHKRSYSGAVSVGLEGGRGSTGGTVDVTSFSDIVTLGNRSHAIHAQSIGGGGGAGGSATRRVGGRSVGIGVGVGGTGGSGNRSSAVSVYSDGNLFTGGDLSDGILAQSIGGGGGTGGNAVTQDVKAAGLRSGSATLSVNVGGAGANGSSGNTVNVINEGTVLTEGRRSYGIRAQSIGGGGGDGGAASTRRRQGPGDSISADFNIGGRGGSGGSGLDVSVINEGIIYTQGDGSHGISANSLGGGGGDGGLVLDIFVESSSVGTTLRSVSNIGGTGGGGGTSGDVEVINRPGELEDSGTILTTGDRAYGIFAQSLAGGGGNGGSVLSITGLKGTSDSMVVGVNVGGRGGDGSRAGAVTVLNSGVIETRGLNSHGILAQSIGGGGGTGGLSLAAAALIGAAENTPLVSLGGRGGAGGDAGAVRVDNSGSILTRGDNAHGIFAQSIGGGGGNANMGISLSGNLATLATSNTLSALLGAAASSEGGEGGAVLVNHTGDITVRGKGSRGIVAESINGGGGALVLDFDGLSAAPALLVPDVPDLPNLPNLPDSPEIPGIPDIPKFGALFEIRLGGWNVDDMNANRVQVNSSGNIYAADDGSAGIAAQSIGGGGGSLDLAMTLGVYRPPTASADTLSSETDPRAFDSRIRLGGVSGSNNEGNSLANAHVGAIRTDGAYSPGLIMQTLGGGGGRANLAFTAPDGTSLGPVELTLGSAGGVNESGGDLARTQDGEVVATGALSPGAILQNIGGGGGSAALVIEGPGADGVQLSLGLGSAGGMNLNGGDVTAGFSGGLVSLGDNAPALLAQSIGGGGGELRVSGAFSAELTLGGDYEAAGNGGNVGIVNNGAISTQGMQSHAVMLQSIGGGGGAVFGAPEIVDLSLSSANSGDGGAIRFAQTGDISVLGAGAFGIVAQSLGGGGGWVDGHFAGSAGGAGRGGSIEINLDGRVFATTQDSTAVFAQSAGALGGGNIDISLLDFVRGGSGVGRGIFIDGGSDNTLYSSGSLSAVSTWAIEATTGNDAVVNDGLLVGNIDLGSGANSFDNQAGATFIAFDTIDMRDGNAQGEGAAGAVGLDIVRTQAGQGSAIVDAAVIESKVPLSVIMERGAATALGDQSESAEASTSASPSVEANSTNPGSDPVSVNSITDSGPAMSDIGVATLDPANAERPHRLQPGVEPATNEAEPVKGAAIQIMEVQTTSSGEDRSKGATVPVMDRADPFAGIESLDSADIAFQMASGLRDSLNQSRPAPTSRAAPFAPGTFSNSGTFNMGLSSSRLPIDLLNGAEFENLDHLGTPETNLLFGARVINTVLLDGNFEQTASGHMAFDVAFGPYGSDQVIVTGDAAFAGTGEVILTWLQDSNAVPLFQVSGTTTNNGLEFADTLAVDYSVAAEGDGLYLNIATDFGGVSTLNANGRAFGRQLDSALQAGNSSGIGRLAAFLGNMQAGEEDMYAAVFREMNPESHVSVMHTQLDIANTTASDLFRCGHAGGTLEDQCVWSRVEMNMADRVASTDNFSVERTGVRFGGGVEQPLDNDWSAAVAIGFDQSGRIVVDTDRAMLETQSISAAIGLQRDEDRGFTFGSSLSGGWSWGDSERRVSVFEPGMAAAEFETGYLRMESQLARQIGGHEGGFFVTPAVTVSGTALRHNGLTERGVDGLGIVVEADTQFVGAITPQLTFGHIFRNEAEAKEMVLSITAGTRLSSTDQLDIPVRFVGANPVSAATDIGTFLDDEITTLSAGIQLIDSDRLNVSFGFDAEFGEFVDRERAGLDVRLRF